MTERSPQFQLVDSESRLLEMLERLRDTETYFLDTEFDSSHRGTRLCLVQIATSAGVFLVDPLRLQDLRKMGPVLGREDVSWVVHAGSQDIPLLEDAFRVRAPRRLFDTQVAWSLLTAESSVGLAYLKYRILGLRSSKAHQTDDWTRRPLPLPLLEYAASDVTELPEMARVLVERAEQRGRVEAIYAASHETLTQKPEPPPELTLKSFRNAWQLESRSQAALAYLIEYHNRLPREQRALMPEPKVLLAIAGRTPESPEVLARLKGVSQAFVDRFGKEITLGMRKAKEECLSDAFEPLEPPPYTTFEDERLDAWFALMRAEVCTELSVAPDFVLPARVIRSLRESLRQGGVAALVEPLNGFRKEFLAAAIQNFSAKTPPPVSV
jgi:ribonuclease D